MSHDSPHSTDSLYDAALVGSSFFFLVHVVAGVHFGGRFAEGATLWPLLIGLSLSGHILHRRWVGVFVCTVLLIGAAGFLTKASVPLIGAVLAASGAMCFASSNAEFKAEAALEAEATAANRMVREVKRLEAAKRKFLDKSERLAVGSRGTKARRGRRGVEEQQAIYQFHRKLLLELLASKSVEEVAEAYRRALKKVGVCQGLVVTCVPGRRVRLGTAWGIEDPPAAVAALVSQKEDGFLEWLVQKRSIIETQELTTHHMLSGARERFHGPGFVPTLLIPSFCDGSLVLAVVTGRQERGSMPLLAPTLFSPLMAVQEAVLALLLGTKSHPSRKKR